MKPPAIQFYFSDFLASTIHMTHGERGLYIMLLGTQWTQGYVTESDFARAARGLTESDSVDIVRSKFQKCDDGHLRQARMEIERQKQITFRQERSESGRKGALAKARPKLSLSSAEAQPKPPSPSPSPTSAPKVIKLFAPPSMDEVKDKAREIGLSDNEAEKFWFYYQSNGWRAGRNPMKDWESSLHNWKRNCVQFSGNRQQAPAPVLVGSLSAVVDKLIADYPDVRRIPGKDLLPVVLEIERRDKSTWTPSEKKLVLEQRAHRDAL